MKYVYNPLVAAGLDNIGTDEAANAGGSNTQIQFNDSGSLGGSADLTWDDTGKELGVGGDINLDDGGTYTTTVQCVTPTANRTVSFPDATGTVALVAGSSGQLTWNNAGAYAGASTLTYDGSILTTSGRFINSYNATASAPAKAFTGTWFTGGTSTTTKPQVLIEPTGTTSTAWSTSGTGLGVNAASGFTGNLLDLQVNGTSQTRVSSAGNLAVGTEALTNFGASSRAIEVSTTSNDSFLSAKGGSVTAALSASGGSGAGFIETRTNHPLVFRSNITEVFKINSTTQTFADAKNIAFGTTTGTKIGTATTQKLGFYNATPVVQPAAVADATDAATVITQLNDLLAKLRTLGLIAT